MGSPGPATISLMAAGSAYGVRRSLSYLIGIIVGTTIVLLAVATGITAALLAVPAIGAILIWIVHVYAAIWVKGTLSAMTRGSVSGGWAWKHHRKWFRQEVGKP